MKESSSGIQGLSKRLLHDVGGFVGSDEAYTPRYGVEPILKYIPKGSVVWCPFDTADSEFVKVFIDAGFTVIASHIDDDKDFFTYDPGYDNYDYIVSNPPFKGKRKFFERALELDKPFALLMTMACLNDKYPAWSFKEHNKDLQILKFDKRIKFTNPDGRPNNKITFSSGYFCYNVLPSNFILEQLDNK